MDFLSIEFYESASHVPGRLRLSPDDERFAGLHEGCDYVIFGFGRQYYAMSREAFSRYAKLACRTDLSEISSLVR